MAATMMLSPGSEHTSTRIIGVRRKLTGCQENMSPAIGVAGKIDEDDDSIEDLEVDAHIYMKIIYGF
ncbi:hypothetical protein Tco_0672767 [Tanacetum coccineum]